MEKYLEYFCNIASIPHGSRNTKMISDYIKAFAVEHGLKYRQDASNNIVVFKKAHPDYADHESVILQAHMDMVAVKTADCMIDMASEGLDLYTEGDYLYARGTSLGGDDGIGVAYMLTLLDGDYKAPELQCIFTVDEEIGMEGATALDMSDITGRRMINLDQEEEGVFVVSCAGGARVDITMPTDKDIQEGTVFRISLNGLKGGHSGIDIDKKRGNAIKVLGEELCKLNERIGFKLIEINGGTADNAIPFECEARIMLTGERDNSLFASEIRKLNGSDYCFGSLEDPDMGVLTVTEEGKREMIAFSDADTVRVLKLIKEYPYGIVNMNEAVPDMVETSLSPGILKTNEESVLIGAAVRSSSNSEKGNLIYKLCKLAKDYDAAYEVYGEYPGWGYVSDSSLRETMVSVYRELFDKMPEVIGIHAGLECGIFAEKLPGLDCVSIGPDSIDIHTVKEHLSLSSARRCFELIKSVLEKL